MSKHEQNRAAATYHAFIATVLLLLGGSLLGFGIWLRVSNSGGPTDLEYGSDNFFTIVLAAWIFAVAIGGFFIVSAICAYVALAKRCVGQVFRVIYILTALVVLAVLLLVAVLSFIIIARRGDDKVRDFLQEAWNDTVDRNANVICGIEQEFKCRGFTSGACNGASEDTGFAEQCADCSNFGDGKTFETGCYDEIVGDLRHVYLPLGIVSSVVALFVLVDVFVVCAL